MFKWWGFKFSSLSFLSIFHIVERKDRSMIWHLYIHYSAHGMWLVVKLFQLKISLVNIVYVNITSTFKIIHWSIRIRVVRVLMVLRYKEWLIIVRKIRLGIIIGWLILRLLTKFLFELKLLIDLCFCLNGEFTINWVRLFFFRSGLILFKKWRINDLHFSVKLPYS